MTSFRTMRETVEKATETLLDAIAKESGEEELDAVVLQAAVEFARVALLMFVQIAQEFNETKHILAEYTAERE